MIEAQAIIDSPLFKPKSQVRFELFKEIPLGLAHSIEKAVQDFIETSHLPEGVDAKGFYYQTLQAIANASVLRGTGDLWLGVLDGELVSYVLGNVNNDYDGRLNYLVTQAWVRKDQRGQKWVKLAWAKIRERAKACLCQHFSIISSRGMTAAYCRFLGKGFRPYAEILKAEI
jgi:hypothetical protein